MVFQGNRDSQESFPFQINSERVGYANALPNWIMGRSDELQRTLLERGAILFRGFELRTHVDFERVCRAFVPHLSSYVGGGSPRTRIASGVYTSTEYIASAHIPLHNEASYLYRMPRYIFFFVRPRPLTVAKRRLAICGASSRPSIRV
jgi:Taurine catabolism dioxygenase TauD, TfdA family